MIDKNLQESQPEFIHSHQATGESSQPTKSPIRDYLLQWGIAQAQKDNDNPTQTAAKLQPEYTPWNSQVDLNEKDASDNDSEDPQHETDFANTINYRDGQYVGSIESSIKFLPGYLIGFTGNHRFDLAIVTRIINIGSPVIQCYTRTGRYVHIELARGRFSTPQFASQEELSTVLPYIPAKPPMTKAQNIDSSNEYPVPRVAGSHLLKKMHNFSAESDRFYRKHAHKLDNLYTLLSHPSDTQVISIRDVAQKVSGCDYKDVTDAMRWTVHKMIKKTLGTMLPSTDGSNDPKAFFLPEFKKNTFLNVATWVREYQDSAAQQTVETFDHSRSASTSASKDPMSSFIKKAQILVTQTRRQRKLSQGGSIGPMEPRQDAVSLGKEKQSLRFQPHPSIRFNSTDRSILHFLSNWVVVLFPVAEWVKSAGPMILRATGLYDGFVLDQVTGFTFLKELGVILPWENRSIYRPMLRISGHEDQGMELHVTSSSTAPENVSDQDYSHDYMAAFRQDFPDSNVYCVDSGSTVERDDAFSIEVVNEHSAWVHVHIANPSAYLKYSSPVAQYAEVMKENIYLPERRYSMLPSDLAEKRFSLASGAPAITFSAKIDNEGNLMETKIGHYRLKNVIILSYNDMRKIFQPGSSDHGETRSILEVGKRMNATGPETTRKGTNLTEDQIKELKRVWDLTIILRSRRMKKVEAQWWHKPPNNYQTMVELGSDHPPFQLHLDRPYCAFGDPWIALKVDPLNDTSGDHSPEASVAELMVMAGRVAAQWCKARRIPVFYTGSLPDPLLESISVDFYNQVARPAIDRYGYAPIPLRTKYAALQPGAQYLSEPTPHDRMGIDAYVRVTSPLRRWADLVTHWQIEAAIRKEATHSGIHLYDADANDYLPFSKAHIEDHLPSLADRTTMINSVQRTSVKHWTMQLFHRAFYFQEAPLPPKFTFTVFRLYPEPMGFMEELRVSCKVAECEALRNGEVNVGDTWECKIKSIECYMEGLSVELIRPIEKMDLGFI